MDRTVKTRKQDKTTWKLCDSDRVCSYHFVDGETTVTHSFPELNLDYEKQIPEPRREIVKHPVPPKKAKKHIAEETVHTSPPFITPPRANQYQHPEFPPKHWYYLLPCRQELWQLRLKGHINTKISEKIKYLVGQNKKSNTRKISFTWRLIKSDQIMNFFTGLGTIKLFNSLFELNNEPYTKDMVY